MYKSIALLKCKPGLSREEFISYYENNLSLIHISEPTRPY